MKRRDFLATAGCAIVAPTLPAFHAKNAISGLCYDDKSAMHWVLEQIDRNIKQRDILRAAITGIDTN